MRLLNLKLILFTICTFFFFSVNIFLQSAWGQILQNDASSPYTFTLNNQANTSAGVYKDSTLIRTLWSLIKYDAGTYPLTWDGKDDLGNPMPAGNYNIKVVSNNVKYEWQGVIGNTSSTNTGSTVHRGFYYFMTDLTFAGNTAYYCSGYSEARPSVFKFGTLAPQQKLNLESPTTTTAQIEIADNDGNNIYWAAYDPYVTTKSFVYGTKLTDGSDATFEAGQYFKPQNARAYNSTISYTDATNSTITGLAVQKKHNFLFISRKGLNKLYVLDKTTGSLVQTISVNMPGALCVDGNDNLWIISGTNNIQQYAVSSSGLLAKPMLSITGTSLPMSISVSPDNSTVTICDTDPASQQVKAFSNITGVLLWTLGDAGGYYNSPSVNNHKFYYNYKGGMATSFYPFVRWQSDGTFWVNDPGNFRVIHFDANRNYIENIMACGPSYSTWADRNDLTRVGANYMEFQVDNTIVPTGSSGWSLKKNYGANISNAYDGFTGIKFTTTITSGGITKTFAFIRRAGADPRYMYEVIELMPGDKPIRFTGIIKQQGIMDKDGNYISIDIDKNGNTITNSLKKFAFNGFDNLGNIIWSSAYEYLYDGSKLPNTQSFPPEGPRNDVLTASNKVIFYNYYATPGLHLGAIQKGDNKWLWGTAMATDRTNYLGPFPGPKYYDSGNYVVNEFAGSNQMIVDNNIYIGYHGENWKQGQTNYYNHYADNGLAVGQFGIGFGGGQCTEEAPAMMAGNALTPQMVKGETTDINYLWHGDESFHAGIHRWKISGLNSIAVQIIPITYPSTNMAPAVLPGVDLLAGVPAFSTFTGAPGWTRYPVTDGNNMTTQTGYQQIDVVKPPDIYVNASGNVNAFISRSLPSNSSQSDWSITGKLNTSGFFFGSEGNYEKTYLTITDNGGKIILRIDFYQTGRLGVSGVFYGPVDRFNTSVPIQIIKSGTGVFWSLTFGSSVYSGTVKIFDNSANINLPDKINFIWGFSGHPSSAILDVTELRFLASKSDQIITFNGLANQKYGVQPFLLTAWSSANLPITYSIVSGPAKIIGNILTITGSGKIIVKADQTGNDTYNPASSVIQTFTVTPSRIDL